MEKIPLELLIKNAKQGKVTREIYVKRILEDMLYLPLLAFVRWECAAEDVGKEFDRFDCIDKVLEIFGMSYSSELCYIDIVHKADILLRSVSTKDRGQLYEAAEPLICILSSLYKRFGW